MKKKVTALLLSEPVIVFPSLISKKTKYTQLAVSMDPGIALDPKSGSLYVVNFGNNSVLKYSV